MEKLKMDKKKLFFILFFVLLLGMVLRFFHIDKPEGMWNDEYLTWEIASASFPYEFFHRIAQNCHAPLHYIYLKLWMLCFGDDDLSLRFSSYVPGVLSILMMFFAGRNIGKKTSDVAGISCALFCAISSFLIYFSQEVRIYSLLFFLSALHFYVALKTLDNPSKKNCIFFVISALLVMLEHTIGFVFVFFSSIGVIFFANKNAKFKKFLVNSFLIALIAFIPVGIFLYNVMFNQQYFSQWWAPFSWAKLAFFFSDLFTPHLINITNAPPSFLQMAFNNGDLNFGFILFVFIPLGIAFLCLIKGVLNFDKNIKYFLFVSVGVYLTVFVASVFGKILFLTKYLIEIYPALIMIAISGLLSFKDKNFKIVLSTVYCVLSLFFIFTSKYSPVNLVRGEGHNIPIAMLDVLEKKESDKVMFLYYPKDRFSKYSDKLVDNSNVSHISKYDFTFIKDKNEIMKDTYNSGKETYKPVFSSSKNVYMDNFLNKNVFSTIKKGDKFFLVDFAPVSIFSPSLFNSKLANEAKYQETPFLFLVFSFVRNYIVSESQVLLSFNEVYSHEAWRIYVFEKT